MIQLLLVEDDSQLAGSLGDYLGETGFVVDFAFNGKSCIELTQQNHYDIIVMDVAMPHMDGLSATEYLRQNQNLDAPILFLTARDTLEDKLKGFEVGGDDYVIKPFEPKELVVRLRALLKRARGHRVQHQQLGELVLDHQMMQVSYKDKTIDLHDIQFRLLHILANDAPGLVSRSSIEQQLWSDQPPEGDALRTHVYRLRKAMDKSFNAELIQTVRGKGYRLAIPN